jgi:hypothetical protein
MSKEAIKVGFRLSHKIQPQKFESLEVALYVEETISQGENRDSELDAFTRKVTNDFQRSFSAVMKDLGVEDRPVSVTMETADGTVKSAALPLPEDKPGLQVKVEPKKKNLVPTNDQLDDFFDRI